MHWFAFFARLPPIGNRRADRQRRREGRPMKFTALTVVASTGKSAEAPYLKGIGAAEVIGRDAIATGPKPLEEQRWAGAIDAVGGAPLQAILSTMKKNGVVCCFGNAAGETFTSSI